MKPACWFDTRREQYCWYEEVPASLAREPVRRVAEEMLAEVRRDLGMPDLRIQWYTEKRGKTLEALPKSPTAVLAMDPTGNPSGWFDHSTPDTIWIRTTAKPLTVALSVVHEARHAWQYRQWGPAPPDNEADWKERVKKGNADARDYERRMRPFAERLAKAFMGELLELRRDENG